jgi:hypothetical protein
MAEQRKKQFEELDKASPRDRAHIYNLMGKEQGGERNKSMVYEALSNRARERNQSLVQASHSDFYGPNNKYGVYNLPHDSLAGVEDTKRAEARVRGGQNLIDSATDQGSTMGHQPGDPRVDPNFNKYYNDPERYHTTYTSGKNWQQGAEQFADMTPEWGTRDRAARTEYDRAHPSVGGSTYGPRTRIDTSIPDRTGGTGGGFRGGGGDFGGGGASGGAPLSMGNTINAATTTPWRYQARGDMNLGGHHYPFVTGGGGKGAIPYGDYNIGPRENHPLLHGSSYQLTPANRATEEAQHGRGGFFLHRSSMYGTLGCLGIPTKLFPAFEQDMAAGRYRRVHVGPSGE